MYLINPFLFKFDEIIERPTLQADMSKLCVILRKFMGHLEPSFMEMTGIIARNWIMGCFLSRQIEKKLHCFLLRSHWMQVHA